MWRPERWRERGHLSAYWNAWVRGARGEHLARLAAPLDKDFLETIERIREGNRPLAPDPRFVARLERDLRRDFSPALTQSAPLHALTPVPGDGLAPLRPWTPPARRDPARFGQFAPQLATALLVLLTLAAVYYLLIAPQRESTVAPVLIPAATPATPAVPAGPVELTWRIAQPWGIPSVDPLTGNVWLPADFGSYAIVSPDGEVLETWGTRGSGEGEFDLGVFSGAGIYGGSVFDPTGNLFAVDSGNHRIQKFGPDRSLITSWGDQGYEDGQFQVPREIAVDAQGRLYVTDEIRHDVQVFDADGTFLLKFGSQGLNPGEFYEPAGVTIDRDGNVWIGDFGNSRIQKFSPEGAFLGAFGNSGPPADRLGNTFGVAASADGYIFVPNSRDDRIHVFDTAGNQLMTWGRPGADDNGFEGPSEVVLDGQGNLYVSDGGGDNLRKFRILLPPLPPTSEPIPSGSSATPAAPAGPVELTWRIEQSGGIPSVDPITGNVWLPAGRGAYEIVSADGERIETWGTQGSGEGEIDLNAYGGQAIYGGSVFDDAGNFYVVDTANRRIQKFGPDRSFVTSWGVPGSEDGQFQVPREIASDPQGRLFVTDEGRHDVQVFTSDGTFLRRFGSRGTNPGELIEPAGVAIDRDGNVWVGDWGNNRIQKFSPEGTHLGVFGHGEQIRDWLSEPFGVAADAFGHVFVADSGNDRIQVFDTAGNHLLNWGQEGTNDDDFASPNQLVLDGQGDLYISFDNGQNLRKFRILLPPLPPTSELIPPATPVPATPAQGTP